MPISKGINIVSIQQQDLNRIFNEKPTKKKPLNSDQSIDPNSFKVYGLIGKGGFGEVYLVEKKDTQLLYAMKVLDKSKIISKTSSN